MNSKIEEYRKKAKKLNRTIISIAVSIFLLGVLISISYYAINKLNSKNNSSKIEENIGKDDYENSGTGVTYYVSSSGDSKEGTDIENPMSLEEANKKEFNGNDRVLFKCGETFYGYIKFNVQTIENDFFYIGSYGNGEKPIISGAKIANNNWDEDENGIFKIDLSADQNFDGYKSKSNNIGFLSDISGKIYGNRKSEKEMLKNEMDFCVKNNILYVKCSINPFEKFGRIKLTTQQSLLFVSSNTMVENLNLQYTGAHAILHKNKITNNVCIRNCIIENIGGSIQNYDTFTRYGNGIEFWNQANNTLIENCIIRNVYDAGYTVQGSDVTEELGFYKNICRNNIFINCTYDIEMFCRNDKSNKEICKLERQQIYNNISVNQGRGWGFDARPVQNTAATFVVWNIQKNNTDVVLENNIYYNFRRINYICKGIDATLFKSGMQYSNNSYYLNNDSYLINNEGSYFNRNILTEYNIDSSKKYTLLTNEEINNINYDYILLSNNYEFIKKYYELFEDVEYNKKIELGDTTANVYIKNDQKIALVYNNSKKSYIPYTNYKATDIYGNEIENNGTLEVSQEPILIYNLKEDELYNNIYKNIEEKSDYFIEKYKTKLDSKNLEGIRKKTEQIKEESKKILELKEPVTNQYTINLIEKIYQNGESIINVYKENNNLINNEEVVQMLSDILDISVQAEKLLSTSKGEVINYNKKTDIEKNIKEFEKIGQFYNEVEASSIYKLENEGKEYYKKITADVSNENDLNNIKAYYETLWAYQLMKQYDIEYIKNNPVTIDYSETNPTNQNVTATLRTNAQITINNNSNSKVYTFTQNGTFTFDYTIKGQTFQQAATVNNIDKTAPTIEGVENDRLYLSEVTPKASDTNLKEVLLYKDNNQVQNYQQNTQITEDGHYKLVAKDSAENQTSVEFDISRNPAIIDYSEVNLTNQDVVATVNSNFDVNVKNNSNQKSYTFKENGEFTFELNIKGAELQLTAKVDNIDKTPPTITDVEDKKQYIDKVTPKISDDNLNEVKLYFDSEEVQGYTPNSEITGEGFYKLVAKDLAGNETSVEFTIIENPDEKYQIKDGNILNIKNNTNQDTFRKKLKMSGEYSIYRNDTLISDNDKIATGDKLRKSTGEEYTLIVSGDINNDGDVNIKDIVMLRKYLLERNNLNENSLLAADCNLDGKDISIKDLIRMRLIALERDVN